MTGSSSDEAAGREATGEDGRVKLVRRPLADRADRIANELAASVRELRDQKCGTSEQRLMLAATSLNLHMLADAVREQSAELAAATARAEQAEALAAERVEAARQREETWRDSAMQARAELETLRAGLGETPDVEWAVQTRGAGTTTWPATTEAHARRHMANIASQHRRAWLMTRLVGEWREVEGGNDA